jgi:hypothetical protein
LSARRGATILALPGPGAGHGWGAEAMAKPLAERVRRRLRRRVWAPFDERVLGAIRGRRNAQREFTPVFVTGAMGSGTTLLALSLAQRHEFACVVTESAHEVDAASPLFVPRIDAFPSVAAYRSALEASGGASSERARRDLLALYRRRASRPGRFALDKGPNANLVRAALLARAFPDARFVLVFRDPVANVEGFRRKWPTFGRDALDASIAFYAALHEAFLAAAPALGPRAIAVAYEALVEGYDAQLARIGGFLGLPPASRPRALPERGNHRGQGIRNVTGGRIHVVTDANQAAYACVAPGDAERIRTRLGPLHARLCELARGSGAA